jgi:hypothetical protein
MTNVTVTSSAAKTYKTFDVPGVGSHRNLLHNLALQGPIVVTGLLATAGLASLVHSDNNFMIAILFAIVLMTGISGSIVSIKHRATRAAKAHSGEGYHPSNYDVELYHLTVDVCEEITAYVKGLMEAHNVVQQNRYGAASNMVRKAFFNRKFFSDKVATSTSSFYIADGEPRLEFEITYAAGTKEIKVTSWLQ